MEVLAATTLVALSVAISVLLGRIGITATVALIDRDRRSIGELNR
jgi:hypothetical protein